MCYTNMCKLKGAIKMTREEFLDLCGTGYEFGNDNLEVFIADTLIGHFEEDHFVSCAGTASSNRKLIFKAKDKLFCIEYLTTDTGNWYCSQPCEVKKIVKQMVLYEEV